MEARIKLKNNNPKAEASIMSKLFFTWVIQLYRKILRNGLKTSDLYKILESDSSERLGDKLEENWNKEIARANLKHQKPKLLRAIIKTFFWNYMIYGAILFVQNVGLRCFPPIVLSYLISLFAKTDEDNREAMYMSAGILVTVTLLIVITLHHTNFGQALIGMRIRIAVSSLIYRKALKLNRKSLNQTSVGQIVNLLSNDVTRFDLVVFTLHYLWILPFQAAVITYLGWLQVGISSLTGIISIAVLSLPVQGYLGKLTSIFRLRVAQRTDHRVTLMSEIISGIQVIKMYAWEKPFERIVRSARFQEVKALRITNHLRGVFLSFMIFVERIALCLTLVCHVLLGNAISAQQVFSMAQFFNLLQLIMTVFYPMSISYGAETLVSIDRIQKFLTMEENEKSRIEVDFDRGVVLDKVRASWRPDQALLEDLTVSLPPGCLCAIVGAVGAGKSSLLHLLLNELVPETGRVKIQGTVSYSSQEPWLFASTIRNNILFGQRYIKKLYNKVVKVCALRKDFDQLELADRTLVGERGTALSGGQRARINLARAIYRDADVYVLDDPLSAVDTHVGKHLFEECIVKYLKGKTRILVTHQLQYLKAVDTIILINNGRIEAQGTYEELSRTNLDFSKDNTIAEEVPEKDSAVPQNAPLLLSSSFMFDSVDLRSEHDDEEKIEITRSGQSTLLEYIAASGNRGQIFFVTFALILCQILCSGADYWLTFWTHQEALRNQNITINETIRVPITQTIEYYPSGDSPIVDTYVYTYNESRNLTEEVVTTNTVLIETYTAIYIYSGLIVSIIIVTLIRTFSYFNLTMTASENLHKEMFATLLQAPMGFFNNNPSGRILNRFSKDMGAIDEILPKVLLESIQITLIMCGILVMVVISNYYMIAAVVVMGFIFMKIRSWFIETTKNIKHLEGITKSPVFSHLNSTLNGIITIRAFDAGEMLQKEFDVRQNVHTSAWFLTIACMVSFGLWLDLICVAFIACTSFSFILLNQYDQVDGSLVGLAISQSLILTGMLQYGIRQSAEVVNQLTSVERILQYTEIEKEGPFSTIPENLVATPWPDVGSVDIRDLYLRYSPSDAPVLKNLNVKIKPGEKIGIVGRTGAGKSSLVGALFRLTAIEGNIFIDGVDTKLLGLHDLRKNLSIIPQEPVLFSASLRYNLDPFDEFDDDMLWRVLEEVELKEIVDGLEMAVAGSGRNFSVGQRQLLCLARAILRNNKILVLDEATANIDQKTDSLIQQTIRKKFKSCTVLTIAHRLNTVMDSDRMIVMDNGEIVEFDYPYKLLQKPETIFYKMVSETGLAMSLRLEEVALEAFLNRREH